MSENKPTLTDKEIEKIMNFCEQYRSKLLSRCRLFFKSEGEYAADCVQETFAALFEALKSGASISNYEAWLYKVMLNKKNNAVSDKIKRREYAFTTTEEKDMAMENAAQYTPDFTAGTVSDEAIEKAAAAVIAALAKDEQYLYYEHYQNGKKLKDIAAELGVGENAIYVRNTRLKKKIKKLAEEILM